MTCRLVTETFLESWNSLHISDDFGAPSFRCCCHHCLLLQCCSVAASSNRLSATYSWTITMGVYECESCGYKMCGETFGCMICGYAQGDGNVLCDGCAQNSPCHKCGNSCCVQCSSHKHPCCGMVICGSGKKDSYDSKEAMRKEYGVEHDACIWEHQVAAKKLECGHAGCNFHEGCYTCKMNKIKAAEDDGIEEDKVLVEELMKKASSDSLKSCLRGFLDDPRSKKRKRDDEKLEKYRNAVNACTCDAKYFAY